MEVPAAYIKKRQGIPIDEVSYGVGGIKLFNATELDEGQVGYSITAEGESLCGYEEGDWRPTWLVIGYDTAVGDPLFIDTSDPALPVLTAVHGQGTWEPSRIAVSIDTFTHSLNEFARVAKGRNNPAQLESNPLPDNERAAFLKHAMEMNGFEPEFWSVQLES
jgi:hypothetical protein